VRRRVIVDSVTRKARAMSAVGIPQIVRRVSATRASSASAGWQQVKMSRSRSSTTSSSPARGSTSVGARAASSRSLRRSTVARRSTSVARLRATVMSQPAGLAGTPSAGQRWRACTSASCAQSSARVQSPVTRISVATIWA
jgi:hypothetical protein